MEFLDELARLRRYTTPTIVRALTEATGSVPPMTNGTLRPLFADGQAIVGRAVTATLSPCESPQPRAAIAADILELLHSGTAPVVAVVHDATGDAGCIWDKATTQLAKYVGCVGIITDGEVTDLVAVEQAGLPMLTNGPALPDYRVELTDKSGVVEVAGLHVEAGDIIHADRHGATVVPEDVVPVLAGIADSLIDSHTEFLEWLHSGRWTASDIVDHLRDAAVQPKTARSHHHWWRRS